ncbi:unnamed protein product, partial [Brenthis ino]
MAVGTPRNGTAASPAARRCADRRGCAPCLTAPRAAERELHAPDRLTSANQDFTSCGLWREREIESKCMQHSRRLRASASARRGARWLDATTE